jgi:hypothetical protein
MKSVLPSVYIGLFLANICAISSLAKKGQKFTPVIMKITGLSAASTVAVILAVGDRTASRMAALAMAQALLKAEAVATLNQDYTGSIGIFNQVEKQAMIMADDFSNGFIYQYRL